MKLTLGTTKPPIRNPRGIASTPSAVSDRPGLLLYNPELRPSDYRMDRRKSITTRR